MSQNYQGSGWSAPATAPRAQGTSAKKKVGIGCGGCLGVFVLIGIIGALAEGGGSHPAKAEVKHASVVSTSAPTPATPTSAKPTDTRKPMPALVGTGLQEAQDRAQAQGFRSLTSHDLSGLNRGQINDGEPAVPPAGAALNPARAKASWRRS